MSPRLHVCSVYYSAYEFTTVLFVCNKKLHLSPGHYLMSNFLPYTGLLVKFCLLRAALLSCSINSPICLLIHSFCFTPLSFSSYSPSWSSSLQWNVKKKKKIRSKNLQHPAISARHLIFFHILSLLMPANSCYGDGEVLGECDCRC